MSDLQRRGVLLHRRRHLHRVAGQDVLARARLAEDHVARSRRPVRTTSRTPQVSLEPSLRLARARWVSAAASTARRAIVVVPDRQAEDRDDRVADDLLDRAAVRLEDGAHLVEVEGQDLAQRLGVEPLAERRRALEVGGDDGDDPPDLLGRSVRGQLRPALSAQPKPRWALGVTGGALDHVAESMR